MTIGDQADQSQRVRSLLPPSWFHNGPTPVLDTLIAGVAALFVWNYALYTYTLKQMRIRTATGVWLDRISYDFLADALPRRYAGDALTGQITSAEIDEDYRTRILDEILRPRQTRAAVSKALSDLTGWEPVVIELFNPQDCGGYDIGVFAYDTAGCYGDLSAHNQILVTAYRPFGEGIANVNGFDGGFGGYDLGGGEYIDIEWVQGPVKDSDIYSTTARIVAAGITAWVAIADKPALLIDLDGALLVDFNGMLLTDP